VQEELEVLEARVQELVEWIRRLKKEKLELDIAHQQKEKECRLLHEEKATVRQRIERILQNLNEHAEEKG